MFNEALPGRAKALIGVVFEGISDGVETQEVDGWVSDGKLRFGGLDDLAE